MTFEQWGIVLLAITQFGRMWLGYRTDKNISHIKRVGDETHTLSNSGMGAQLQAYSLVMKMYYLALKRIAELTGIAADNIAASKALDDWVEAVKMVERHQSKEARAYKLEQSAWDGPDRRTPPPVPPAPQNRQEGVK